MIASDQAFVNTSVPLLSHFTDDQRRELVEGALVRSFQEKEVILHGGDEVHFLGVLLEGTIEAVIPSAGGGDLPLGKIEAGGTFGELALMSGDPAVADLVAATPCRVMLVPLTLFQSRIMANPGAAQLIAMTVSNRVQMAPQEPAMVAAVSRKAEAGELLELKGERPERILVINCGSSSLKYRYFDTEHPDQGTQEGAFQLVSKWCTQQESNLHRRFRKPLFYPLNYGCKSSISAERWTGDQCVRERREVCKRCFVWSSVSRDNGRVGGGHRAGRDALLVFW